MELVGNIVRLVPFGAEHLNSSDYLKWLRDYDVVKTINRPEYLKPISFKEVKNYVESVWRSESDIFLAITLKADGKFIGTARVSQINRTTQTADLGILIGDREQWGRGVATDTLSVLAHYMFEHSRMRRLTAGLIEPNVAMKRVFEKLGFNQEGVFRKHDLYEGEFVDHIYLGCFASEFVPQHSVS